MTHLRAVFNWFSKSHSRKAKFASLSEELMLIGRVVTWKMVYPKYYCPTRWVGICTALSSIVGGSDLHEEYASELVADGYLPDRSQGMEAEDDDDLPDLVDAAGARVEFGEENEDDLQRVDEQGFYEWEVESPQPWDLHVSDIEDDFPIKDKAALVDLDTCAMKALVPSWPVGFRDPSV